jgi:16S rRNA (adenine(1408)-N(1))-methyltransferase
MESIRGKHAAGGDAATLARQSAGYAQILIDLGTGDGRFVRHMAATTPGTFAIGIDLCAANLRAAARRAPANAAYLVAGAYALPPALHGLATHLTVNFPWGDLLTGLLAPDARLPAVLAALARPGARLDVRLNAGALTEAGWTLPAAGTAVAAGLRRAGFAVEPPRLLAAGDLRACPTTWAHRLAFGRDPRALYLRGTYTRYAPPAQPTGAPAPRTEPPK